MKTELQNYYMKKRSKEFIYLPKFEQSSVIDDSETIQTYKRIYTADEYDNLHKHVISGLPVYLANTALVLENYRIIETSHQFSNSDDIFDSIKLKLRLADSLSSKHREWLGLRYVETYSNDILHNGYSQHLHNIEIDIYLHELDIVPFNSKAGKVLYGKK